MRKSVWIEKLPGGYSVRYWETSNGASHAKREWFATYNEAQNRKANLKLSLIAKQQNTVDPSVTPIQCFNLYLKDLETTHRASTLKIKKDSLTDFLSSLSSMNLLNEISVRRWKEALLKDYSISTVSIRLRDLRSFCRWAVKNRYLSSTPFPNVPIPLGKELGRKLTLEEIKAIWEASDERFKPYLAFLIYTGARRSEILKTRWTDIEKNVWTIPVEHSKTKQARLVPLDAKIMELLASLKPEGEAIFHGWTGRTPKWYLDKALKHAGVKGKVRVHDFRHTFASYWNGRPQAVMEMLGWKSLSMLKRYSHFSIADLKNEAQSKGLASQL